MRIPMHRPTSKGPSTFVECIPVAPDDRRTRWPRETTFTIVATGASILLLRWGVIGFRRSRLPGPSPRPGPPFAIGSFRLLLLPANCVLALTSPGYAQQHRARARDRTRARAGTDHVEFYNRSRWITPAALHQGCASFAGSNCMTPPNLACATWQDALPKRRSVTVGHFRTSLL